MNETIHHGAYAIPVTYIDNHIIVVVKPAGLLSQGDATGEESLFSIVKEYIRVRFNKPGNVYLGLLHRLDKPTSGIMVFARTSKAASRLSDQFRKHTITKLYTALVSPPPGEHGTLIHHLARNDNMTVPERESSRTKRSVLHFRRILAEKDMALLMIHLETGRKHQIRAQCAAEGFPVVGDGKYSSVIAVPGKEIMLHAWYISFVHPTTKERLSFIAPLPDRFFSFPIPDDIEKNLDAAKDILVPPADETA